MLNEPELTSESFILAGSGTRSLATASEREQQATTEAITLRVGELEAVHGQNLIVMSGMAEGFDALLAEVALRKGIRLWCAVPHKNYGPFYWGSLSRTGEDRTQAFNGYLKAAWHVTFIMEDVFQTKGIQFRGRHSNFWRNDFMVEKAHDFVVQGGLSGHLTMTRGSAHCVQAIKNAKKWRSDMIIGGPTR